jgi:excisionase family DNA binding protein
MVDESQTPVSTLMTVASVAARLGIQREFAERLVRSPNFPRPVEGRRYRRDDVEQWALREGLLLR